jgi:DNA-binding LacI/PurR family transcriptional regulator
LLDHVAAQGASRVALIVPGPQTSWGLDIKTAYRQWCERAADGSRPDLTHDVPFPPSAELLREATLRAVRATPEPDAVVSGIDGAALGALLASTPAITGLDLRPADMGRQLASMLHALIDGQVSPGAVEILEPRLMLRESTARPLRRAAP